MINHIKQIIKKNRRWDVPLLFLLLSLLSVIYLWRTGYVYHNGDFIYHFARINAIRNNLIQGKFPLFNIGGTIPYGTSLTYYPYLTLLPIVAISFFIHNAVNLFYITILLATLATYFVSYYSSHTYDKNWFNNFIFALAYTSSSVLFDFSFREGDIGSLLAVIFIPLAFFGLLRLKNQNKGWLMLALGLSLTVCSHVITGAFTCLALLFIFIFNIKSFKFTGILKAFVSLIIFLAITSIFWYPDAILTMNNNLVMPNVPSTIASGIFSYFDSTCNFIYGIIDIIGLLSIFWCKSKKYHWFDFTCWLVAMSCILINAHCIGDTVATFIPYLLHIQMTYRFALIGHIFTAFLASKLLLGKYAQHHYYRLPLLIVFILLIFTPLTDEVNYHFLMHNRPVQTYQLNNQINHNNKLIKGHKSKNAQQQLAKNLRMSIISQFKMNNLSFKEFRHYFYAYDYAPNNIVTQDNAFDRSYQAQTYNKKNQWNGQIYYKATNNGIKFNNGKTNWNVQVPIVVYKGIKYTFSDNGQAIPNYYINHKLTNKTHELVLNHNLPTGMNEVGIKKASVK